MNNNVVTKQEVLENMQDVIVRTVVEFDKPCTYVTVRMKNGFTVRESTTCIDPANYDENIGKAACLKKIEDKIWLLLGYALQDRLANEKQNKTQTSKPKGEPKVSLVRTSYGDGLGVVVNRNGKKTMYAVDRCGDPHEMVIKDEKVIMVSQLKDKKFDGYHICPGLTCLYHDENERKCILKYRYAGIFTHEFVCIDVKTGLVSSLHVDTDELIEDILDGIIRPVELK